jgi:hypothetical protein
MNNYSNMPVRKSVLITLDQVKDDLRPLILDIIKSDAEMVLKGEDYPVDHLKFLLEFPTWDVDSYLNFWCDLCSETFFVENPTIDDVLVKMDNFDTQWVASRDNE